MNNAETYLRELRRALPIGCRSRFVTEVREHFASAVAAEAEHGVERVEAERLTIERLGPPQALAEQLLADLRSGALGRIGRLSSALTTARLIASAAAVTIAIVAGALFAGRHSSPAPPAPQRTAGPTITVDPSTGAVRAVMYAVETAVEKHQGGVMWSPRPSRFYLTPAPPKN